MPRPLLTRRHQGVFRQTSIRSRSTRNSRRCRESELIKLREWVQRCRCVSCFTMRSKSNSKLSARVWIQTGMWSIWTRTRCWGRLWRITMPFSTLPFSKTWTTHLSLALTLLCEPFKQSVWLITISTFRNNSRRISLTISRLSRVCGPWQAHPWWLSLKTMHLKQIHSSLIWKLRNQEIQGSQRWPSLTNTGASVSSASLTTTVLYTISAINLTISFTKTRLQ